MSHYFSMMNGEKQEFQADILKFLCQTDFFLFSIQ